MKRRASLKTNFLRLGLFIGIVKLVAVVALVWASRELASATKILVDSRGCAVTATKTSDALSHYRRSLLLYRLTGDSAYLADASDYEQRLSKLVDANLCEIEIDAPRRAALIPQAEGAIAEYLHREQAASQRGTTKDRAAIEREIRQTFVKAHAALEEITLVNTQAGAEAGSRAEQVQAVTRQAGTVVGIGSIVLVATLLLLLQQRLVIPMHRLAQAIGEKAERNRRIGTPLDLHLEAELGEIEQAVDELSHLVAEQRSAQHQFVAAVAHDLKTPLQSIRGYCSLVRPHKPLPPEPILRKGFEVIDRQVGKLARQLDDLLDTAHVQSGMLTLNRREFELCELIEEARTMFDNYSDKHRIEVERSLPMRLVGDPLRLSQVLTNLLSNAVKYSPEGGCVTICIRQEENEAVVAVQDPGIGIDDEQLASLFEPFRRGKRVRGLDIPGIGLGLSTSSRIIEAHGGRIEVLSEVGRGSTFTIRLPLSKASRDEKVLLPIAADSESISSLPPPPC